MIKDDLGKKITSKLLFEGEYGLEIETETKNPYVLPIFTYWDVKPDGSLRDFGQEYVLKAPVDYGKPLTEALEEFRNKTSKVDFIQDSNSTSVHVHCNILLEKWQSVGNFLTIYTLIENLLMEVAGDSRRNNLFCLPIRSVPAVNSTSIDIFKLVHKKTFEFNRIMDPGSIKYAALNLATITRFGSLEIRSFRGVTDISIIQSWIDILHRIRMFSRENITPPEILDQYRDKGKKFLKEILEDEWEEIRDPDEDKMLMDNLWFAGKLGYYFSPAEWRKFDIKPEIPKIPEGLKLEELDKLSHIMYGNPYGNLLPSDQKKVISLLQLQKKQKKSKSVFTNIPDQVWTNEMQLDVNPEHNITFTTITEPD